MFAAYGTVLSARIIKDKVTQRSLGYGFVKFSSAADAQAARQALNSHRVDEKTLKVAVARPQGTERNTNVYVAGLDPSVTQEELQTLFVTYGRVIETKVLVDKATNASRGIGFVKFERAEDAESAIKGLNNLVFRGSKPLVVRLAEQKDKGKNGGMGMGMGGGMMGHHHHHGGHHGHHGGGAAGAAGGAVGGAGAGAGAGAGGMMPNALVAAAAHHHPRGGMRYNPMAGGMVDPTWAYSAYGPAAAYHPQAVAAMGMYHSHHHPGMQQQQAAAGGAAAAAMHGMPQQQQMQAQGGAMPPQGGAMGGGVGGGYCLFIYNLPPETDEHYLVQLFGSYGSVSQVKVMRDAATHMCKGFGFVNYYKYEEAQGAIAALNGAQLGAKTLQVSFKKDKMMVPR